MTTLLLIGLGAAVGASLRYLADRFLRMGRETGFPWGTLTVNVAGSFVLGGIAAAVAAGRLDDHVMVILGTGFCGALTTYSSLGYETLRLLEGRARRFALASVVANLAAGTGAAALGWLLGNLLC